MLLLFSSLTCWIGRSSVRNVGVFQLLQRHTYKGFYFFLLYSIHKTRRMEGEYKDVIVASLGHLHYTRRQKGDVNM